MSQRKWSKKRPDTPIRCYSARGLWKSSEDPPWAFTAAVQGVVYQTCKVIFFRILNKPSGQIFMSILIF